MPTCHEIRALTLVPSVALRPGEGLAQRVCRVDSNAAHGLQGSVFSSLKWEGEGAASLVLSSWRLPRR